MPFLAQQQLLKLNNAPLPKERNVVARRNPQTMTRTKIKGKIKIVLVAKQPIRIRIRGENKVGVGQGKQNKVHKITRQRKAHKRWSIEEKMNV